MPLVEQYLLTFLEEFILPQIFMGMGVFMLIFFLCSVCSTIVCLFAQLHLLIVLSVLWFTASDYAFGMFKKFINVEVTESSLYNSRSKLDLPLVIKLVAYHSQLQNKKKSIWMKIPVEIPRNPSRLNRKLTYKNDLLKFENFATINNLLKYVRKSE